MGGINREKYKKMIRKIRRHKYYWDDDDYARVDNTYGNFVFHVPETEFPADFTLPECEPTFDSSEESS